MKARGMGRIYRRGRIWWVQYSHRGRLHRESSGSDRQSEATKLLRRRQGEMGTGRLVGPDVERTTFADLKAMLLTDYEVNRRKSMARARASLAHLEAFFGECRALDITADRVTAYIKHRQESARPAMPATIRNELAALRRMFTLGLQAGKAAARPHIPTISVRNTRTGFFSDEEFRAVLALLPDHLKPVAEFAYFTGWRKGEILSLQWSQVDLVAGTVRLEPGTTKNDEGRTFPFSVHPELSGLLRRRRTATEVVERQMGDPVPWVFHRFGRPVRDLRKAWNRACEAAGAPGRLFHDLRRTAVRHLEEAGVPRSVAMKLSGHKTEAIYRRYAIASELDMRQGVKRLAALRRGGQRRVVEFDSWLRADLSSPL
jgi:integrase